MIICFCNHKDKISSHADSIIFFLTFSHSHFKKITAFSKLVGQVHISTNPTLLSFFQNPKQTSKFMYLHALHYIINFFGLTYIKQSLVVILSLNFTIVPVLRQEEMVWLEIMERSHKITNRQQVFCTNLNCQSNFPFIILKNSNQIIWHSICFSFKSV